MAAERVKARKGFEHKMSKKVAELTQVVHMLFIRNHEREVEIQMTKDLYRKEFQRIEKSYQEKVATLEGKLKSLTDKSDESEEAVKKKFSQSLLELESQWMKKYDVKDSECTTERTLNKALKEKLAKCEQEFSELHSSMSNSSTLLDTKLSVKEHEIDKLRKRISTTDKKLAEERQKVDEITNNLERSLTEKDEEIQSLRKTLDEAQTNEIALARKCQSVEKELKTLKKELARKGTNESLSARGSATTHMSSDSSFAPQEVYEELDQLRKLVQKYRLELSNREGNFNRMFTEKTPVHVDQRTLKTLAPLPLRAAVRDKSLLNPTADVSIDTEKRLALPQPHTRADSGMSKRSMALTGIRRNIAPPGGKQLLTQYSQK
ncbi:protein FAM184A-like [Watersipora subatra]|uniref:protein FAM184A-like n=1 Tax=Watersipora subatra TaxID=2589382 RepID=UPI00355BA003